LRVVVPFTGELRPEVTDAITASGYLPITHDVGHSDAAYWQLLSTLWSDEETVCVIEHDIRIEADTLSSFVQCPNEWCACSYDYLGGSHTGLGCVRFRSSLIRSAPDAIKHIGEYEMPAHGRRHFCTLDFLLQRHLNSLGYEVCRHGHVEHLSDGMSSHGCVKLAA
jgi:hypothetical protein